MEYGYKRLTVWRKADELVKKVFVLVKSFPRNEDYVMTSQLRRAVLSVVLNIVEGYARGGKKELKRFLRISWGSLAETEYLLNLAREMSYLDSDQFDEVEDLREECSKLLWKMIENC